MTQLALVRLEAPVRGSPVLAVRVPVEPMPVPRPRAFAIRVGSRWTARVHDDDDYLRWRAEVEALLHLHWRGREVLGGCYVARVDSVFARPIRPPTSFRTGGVDLVYPFVWSAGRCPYCGPGDVDNLYKGPIDALVAARILLDDRLIVEGTSRKWYAAEGEEPCVEVRLYTA